MKSDVKKSQMPLIKHLIELRRRLFTSFIVFFIAFILCYQISEEIYGFLVKPLADVFEGQVNRRLIYTNLTEVFTTYIKVSIFSSLFLSFPIIASQLWLFIAPGLYKEEKNKILPFLILTPVLFILGAIFAYYLVLPLAWQFFINFEIGKGNGILPIQLEARVSEYLSLVMQLVLAFGVCFQLPILLSLLARIGVVNSKILSEKRKYAFLLILIISAFFTPPDILSMICLAIPIYILYELSILLIYWIEKSNK